MVFQRRRTLMGPAALFVMGKAGQITLRNKLPDRMGKVLPPLAVKRLEANSQPFRRQHHGINNITRRGLGHIQRRSR